MKNLAEYLQGNCPVKCDCGGKFFYIGAGKYQCGKCDNIEMDDFGKVRAFLEENGSASVMTIAQCTGVSTLIIEELLKEGRLEITENSKYYISCERCGCCIRSGRFCLECAKELAQGIQRIAFNQVGEKPKKNADGKMHFLNRKK